MVLLRNSAQEGRKGGKLLQRWLGPYKIVEFIGKGVYKLANPKTGRTLKNAVNICRLKIYHEPQSLSAEYVSCTLSSNRKKPGDNGKCVTSFCVYCMYYARNPFCIDSDLCIPDDELSDDIGELDACDCLEESIRCDSVNG